MTRRRLFPRYALLIIALVGGMLIASSAVSLYFSWRENERQLLALQAEKAQAAALRIEQYVLDIEHQLGWAELPAPDAGGNALQRRRLEYLKLLRQAPAITEVAWLDPAGREQLRISRLAMDTVGSGADFSRRPEFTVPKAGETYYGGVRFRKETEPYMTIARPAGSAGVTAAEMNLKFVWDVVSRIRIGSAGLAYVVDADGTLIAHPDISLVLRKTDLRALPQVAALASTQAAASPLGRDLKGRETFSAHAPIRTLGWTVFVESPRTEALAPLYASITRAALLLAAGLLLAVVASFFLARALVRPIRSLEAGAARIGAGELDQRIEVKTGDELESLAGQFNRMAAQLRDSYAGLERKVEARTAELQEALEHQTAISDVLRVISESPSDVAPVFEAIVDSATRLFGTPLTAIFRYDGKLVHQVAVRNWPAAAIEDARRFYPGPPDTRMMSGRVILSGRMQIEDDTFADPAYDQTAARLGLWRRMIGAPLLKDGITVGAIILAWPEPGVTPPRQVELLKTFADQAVIAIENVRLLNETKEALEQQTASADILKVISQSPSDVQPVFEAIAERAMTLCSAMIGAVARFDGERVHLVAFRGTTAEAAEEMRAAYPMPLAGGATLVRAIRERAPVQVPDVLADPAYALKQAASRAGYRANLAVPMLREGLVVGSIGVCREAPGAFPQKLVRLLQIFADQAVIAIENVRLFNETKEALEQQTATAEVLQVISNSPTDVQPVLDAVAQRAALLCDATAAQIFLKEGDMLRSRAGHLATGQAMQMLGDPIPIHATSMTGRAVLERTTIHCADVLPLMESEYPAARINQRRLGFRAVLAVPLTRESGAYGAIFLHREEPRPFRPGQIALVETFARQAAIAIENVRLFNETRDALEQQTATSEVLKSISRTTFELEPVLATLIESASRLCQADKGFVYLREGDAYQMKVSYRVDPGSIDPQPLMAQHGSLVGRTALTREVVHIEDALNDPSYTWKEAQGRLGFRTMLGVPMLREGEPVGVVALWRNQMRSFSERDVRLVTTFADQAVIALENVRLLEEIQAKSRELERANKHKSEFLANMSHELRTPLNAIIGFSEVLSERMFGEVNDKQLEYLHDIHSSGHHLLSLINDILDLSKIEAGRMELELTRFDLGLLLDNAMTLVRERAARHGLALALDVDDAVGDWVADARKVKQVLINLLSNAVKFTPAGGTITVSARRSNGSVEIAVADTGVGIAPGDQQQVFEEFRQASGEYLRKSEGTGLGLSLARRFVELHGGTIRVESALGRGSTFTFTLPEMALATA